eukprot:448371-Ditylum_brightwellii.AAC.1
MLASLKVHAEHIEHVVIGLDSISSTVQDIALKQNSNNRQATSAWCLTNCYRLSKRNKDFMAWADLHDREREGANISLMKTELDCLSKLVMH